jgi:hypothetical protein
MDANAGEPWSEMDICSSQLALATHRRIPTPGGKVKVTHQKMLDDLKAKSGKDFDRVP